MAFCYLLVNQIIRLPILFYNTFFFSFGLISIIQLRRLVVQDLVNLGQNLRRQLVHNFQRLDVLIHLLGTAGTRDGRADIVVLEHPGQRQGSLLDAQPLGNGLQLVDAVDNLLPGLLVGALPVASDEGHLGLGEARVVRNAVLVLAGQDALVQRGEDGEAQAVLAVQELEVALDLCAVEHVVRRLLHQRSDQAQPVGHAPRLGDLNAGPLRGAPVKGLAGVDDVVEGADGLLHGRLAIGTVGVDEVDVLEVQALQGGVDTLDNVLSGEAQVVDGVLAKCTTPVDLSLDKAER